MTDQERIALYQMAYKEAAGPGTRYAIGGTAGAALGVILATTTARDHKEAIRNSLKFGALLGVMGGSIGLKTTPPEEWKKSKDDSPTGISM